MTAPVFTSKGVGRCRVCRRWFAAGDLLLPVEGGGVRHADAAGCAAALPDITPPRHMSHSARRVEIEAVGALLESARWITARPQPWGLHSYTLRKHWSDQDAFTRAVWAIKVLGVSRKWRSSYKPYLDWAGFTYWVMDPKQAPAEIEFLINRQEREATAPTLWEVAL